MNAQKPIKPGETVVTVHEAKTHLSRLIAEAERGKEIVIARGRVPVAKIVGLNPEVAKKRTPGRYASTPGAKGILDHGFWSPLPPDEEAAWNFEGGGQ
jgi:prevent-host-death family protein